MTHFPVAYDEVTIGVGIKCFTICVFCQQNKSVSNVERQVDISKTGIMKRNNLYFLAVVLPEDLQSRIVEIEKYIAEVYNSHKSLNIVPHITLKAPFTISADEHELVTEWFSQLSVQTKGFDVELRDFQFFSHHKHPVIYIDPVRNDHLTTLQGEILNQFISFFPNIGIMHHEHNFRPHVTVAYRDLSHEQFLIAREDFKQGRFTATFHVNDLQLLQHNGIKWNTIDIFRLS